MQTTHIYFLKKNKQKDTLIEESLAAGQSFEDEWTWPYLTTNWRMKMHIFRSTNGKNINILNLAEEIRWQTIGVWQMFIQLKKTTKLKCEIKFTFVNKLNKLWVEWERKESERWNEFWQIPFVLEEREIDT